MHALILLIALAQSALAPPFVSQRVEVGGVTVGLMVTDPASGLSVPIVGAAACALEPTSAEPAGDTKAQTLATTVKDPQNPEEPITITTVRGSNESVGDFLRRHDELVRLVRKKVTAG